MNPATGFYIIDAAGTNFIPPAVVTSRQEMEDILTRFGGVRSKDNPHGHAFFATYDLVVNNFAVHCLSARISGIDLYPTRNWILFLYYPDGQ